MASLPTARGLFRSLLRARATAFKGDEPALVKAYDEIRKHFDVRNATQHPALPSVNTTHLYRTPPQRVRLLSLSLSLSLCVSLCVSLSVSLSLYLSLSRLVVSQHPTPTTRPTPHRTAHAVSY
jgi:hypothetical protein